MKIFAFTTVFAPMIGGIERLTEVLAREWIDMGHEVVVATPVPGPENTYPFSMVRSGDMTIFRRWGRWCDVHLQMNVSLKYTPRAALGGKPTVISHHTRYVETDGRGTWRDKAKLLLANKLPAIRCSDYIRHQVPHAVRIRPPYDNRVFRCVTEWNTRGGQFVFLGRLVSEKGGDTLIEALLQLRALGFQPPTTIIGDGNDRPKLEKMVASFDLRKQVTFMGALDPLAIAKILNESRFIVVPSRYEEPFGIVALEGLVCGCVPIVSRRGGLVEAIGPHGYTFENGDAGGLAQVLADVLRHPDEAHANLTDVETHLASFTGRRVAELYIEVFKSLTA